MKIYTRTGDDGTTGLQGGLRESKAAPVIAAYGAVDEANSAIGLLLAHGIEDDISGMLGRVQSEMFAAGSDLSSPDGSSPALLKDGMVAGLEADIDRLESELEPLSSFVLPGGCRESALAHVARSAVRRAERLAVAASRGSPREQLCIRYLNRLSDLLFVAARALNARRGAKDRPWSPNIL